MAWSGLPIYYCVTHYVQVSHMIDVSRRRQAVYYTERERQAKEKRLDLNFREKVIKHKFNYLAGRTFCELAKFQR